MIKIIFAIDKLNRGGAERQFIELVKGIDKRQFEVWAVIFCDGGDLRSKLDTIKNIKIVSLNRQGRWSTISFLLKLLKTLYRIKPDIIHSYMGGTNEICLIMGKILGIKTVWGIRSSNMNLSHYDIFSYLSFKLGILLSSLPDLIIINSVAGKNYYLDYGYLPGNMVVISNGIDISRFIQNHSSKTYIRKKWGIASNNVLIGLVGRILPKKDQATFLKAAAMLNKEYPDIFFVCVGDGQESYKNDMIKLSLDLGIESNVIWTGKSDCMPEIYNSLDILTLTSAYGEGFPNVIGEAMSCGVPCVVTDVGDSAWIVGDLGIVVKPFDIHAVCEGWKYLINLSEKDKKNLGKHLRKNICQRFSTNKLIEKTQDLLIKLGISK